MSRFAFKLGLIDVPNDRSSHSLPTPRGGGVGILLAFVCGSLLLCSPLYLWCPAALLSLASFFDDRLNLSPRTRLLFQFVAAFSMVVAEYNSAEIMLLPKIVLIVFLAVFVVGTANFYNFMDGVNGIAGMTGMTGFLLLAVHAICSVPDYALLLLVVAIACAAFLPFNVPVARVFMGDVGSILLGFLFAVSVVALASSVAEFIALAGCLFPFYADALTTLYVRWKMGEKLSQAHRRHLYQLLANQKNIPHWKVSFGYAILQAVVGVICLKLMNIGLIPLCLFLCVVFVAWFSVMGHIRKEIELKRP